MTCASPLWGRASIVLHGVALEVWAGRLGAAEPDVLRQIIVELVMPVVDVAMASHWTHDLHSLHASNQPSRTAS